MLTTYYSYNDAKVLIAIQTAKKTLQAIDTEKFCFSDTVDEQDKQGGLVSVLDLKTFSIYYSLWSAPGVCLIFPFSSLLSSVVLL